MAFYYKGYMMKKLIILVTFILGFMFSGCFSSTSNVKTPQMKTSQQVEKELNWKYCKSYN